MTISLATKGMIPTTNCILNFTKPITASIQTCSGIPQTECGEQFQLLRANSVDLDFIVSVDGVKLLEAELLTVEDIIFVLKIEKTDEAPDAILIKKLSLGEMEVLDDAGASAPNVRISLTSSDTDIDAGAYFSGFQIVFSINNCKEAQMQFDTCFFDTVLINEDTVRC